MLLKLLWVTEDIYRPLSNRLTVSHSTFEREKDENTLFIMDDCIRYSKYGYQYYLFQAIRCYYPVTDLAHNYFKWKE